MIDNDYHPIDRGLEATNDHWGTQLAGDVVPIRPPGPAMNAGKEGQKSNEKQQRPNMLDPKNSNISRIYG